MRANPTTISCAVSFEIWRAPGPSPLGNPAKRGLPDARDEDGEADEGRDRERDPSCQTTRFSNGLQTGATGATGRRAKRPAPGCLFLRFERVSEGLIESEVDPARVREHVRRHGSEGDICRQADRQHGQHEPPQRLPEARPTGDDDAAPRERDEDRQQDQGAAHLASDREPESDAEQSQEWCHPARSLLYAAA